MGEGRTNTVNTLVSFLFSPAPAEDEYKLRNGNFAPSISITSSLPARSMLSLYENLLVCEEQVAHDSFSLEPEHIFLGFDESSLAEVSVGVKGKGLSTTCGLLISTTRTAAETALSLLVA